MTDDLNWKIAEDAGWTGVQKGRGFLVGTKAGTREQRVIPDGGGYRILMSDLKYVGDYRELKEICELVIGWISTIEFDGKSYLKPEEMDEFLQDAISELAYMIDKYSVKKS